MHVGSILAPIVAPVACYVISFRRSSFVSAHSLKAMKEWLVLNLTLLLVGVCSISYTIYRLVDLYHKDWKGFSIWEFFLRFAVGYVLFAILGFVTAVISIRQAIKAYRGEPA